MLIIIKLLALFIYINVSSQCPLGQNCIFYSECVPCHIPMICLSNKCVIGNSAQQQQQNQGEVVTVSVTSERNVSKRREINELKIKYNFFKK